MHKIVIIFLISLVCLESKYITLNKNIEDKFVSIDKDQEELLKLLDREKKRQSLKEKEKIYKDQELIAKNYRDNLYTELDKLKSERRDLIVKLTREREVIKRELKRAREIKKRRRENHIVAHVDISSQKMKVYKGDKLIYQWLVSTARKGYFTPIGKYTPQYLEKMHYSRLYHNSPMPYTIFFRGNYAIHGTNSISRLGRKASHGCIRLHPKNAKVLYSMIQKHGKNNTEIKITY